MSYFSTELKEELNFPKTFQPTNLLSDNSQLQVNFLKNNYDSHINTRKTSLIYNENDDILLKEINNKISNKNINNNNARKKSSRRSLNNSFGNFLNLKTNHIYYVSSSFSIKRRRINKLPEQSKQQFSKILPKKEVYTKMDNLKGALLMILSSLIYAFLLLFQKFLFTEYPNISYSQQNIFRGLFLASINYAVVKKTNSQLFFSDKTLQKTLFIRLIFDFFAEFLLFLGTGYLRINTSSTIYILYAVLCSLISSIFLNEQITKLDVSIIISCFFSSCLIIKPFFGDGEDTLIGVLMGLSSSVCFCFMVIYHKFLYNAVSNFTINFYLGCCYFFEGSVEFIVLGETFIYDAKALAYLVLLSLIYCISCYSYIAALNYGKVSYVLPFENLNIVFSLLLGHFVLGESCDWMDIIGTILILCLSVYRCIIMINEEDDECDIEEESLHEDKNDVENNNNNDNPKTTDLNEIRQDAISDNNKYGFNSDYVIKN